MSTYQAIKDSIIVLNGISYFLVECCDIDYMSHMFTEADVTPFTLYHRPKSTWVTRADLEEFRRSVLEKDPSFQPEFLTAILFHECRPNLTAEMRGLLKSWGATEYAGNQFSLDSDKLASGPYFVIDEHIFQPWRMYPDSNLTMTMSFRPELVGSIECRIEERDDSLTPDALRAVAPPKSYSLWSPQPNLPLYGVTILVIDAFDIEGTRTTLGSRAWAEYYPPADETAPCIRRLQLLGAWIAGKTRLTPMRAREEPMECVEFLAPLNPRGDGYQTPSGSNSGSCAAVGAYPWVDFAIGLDSHGGCRNPAYWNGCFALRPTHGVLKTQGVVSCWTDYDVPAFFGRDVSRFRVFAQSWYGHSGALRNTQTVGTKILYPTDYLPTRNKDQARLIDSFVEDLERVLGIKRTEISLAEMWKESISSSGETPDPEEEIWNLEKYLDIAATMAYYKETIRHVDIFVNGYKQKFGKAPFLSHGVTARRTLAGDMTDDEESDAWHRIESYAEFLLTKVLTKGAVLVLPVGEGQPRYRDATPRKFGLLSGYSSLYISPIAGTPEITAPIGEIQYHSKHSQRNEPLPISVSLVSPPGTDLALIDLMHKTLQHGGKPVEVRTGRSIFGP